MNLTLNFISRQTPHIVYKTWTHHPNSASMCIM